MPTAKGAQKIIAADEVLRVFDADCLMELARVSKLPASADLCRFGEGVRDAARIYARDARDPNVNQVYDQIAALWRAADPDKPPQWEAMAIALEALSSRTREILAYRGSRSDVKTSLPGTESLRDPERREAARDAIVKLVLQGMGWVEGRSRGSGKRSGPRLAPVLFAPKKQKNPKRRNAELNFVMLLQIAWLEAVGEMPAQTARHADPSRKLGPFARVARKCLRLVGASDADVVELINELQCPPVGDGTAARHI